jgi:acetyltransferase-like isoleucine patch superfamily enzyme
MEYSHSLIRRYVGASTLILAFARRVQTHFKAFSFRKVLTHGRGLHLGARTKIWAPLRVTVGDNVYIGKDVHIEANCRIGDYCLIANRVAIVGRYDHDFTVVGYPIRFAPWVGSHRFINPHASEQAIIEDEVWLGYGAIILTGVTIGRGCIIAAGSVVTRDIPPYSIAAGVPAKVIAQRFLDQTVINEHEASIRNGHFNLSERGYDYCLIEPAYSKVTKSKDE